MEAQPYSISILSKVVSSKNGQTEETQDDLFFRKVLKFLMMYLEKCRSDERKLKFGQSWMIVHLDG